MSLETYSVRLALATSKSWKDAAIAVLVLIGITYKQAHETQERAPKRHMGSFQEYTGGRAGLQRPLQQLKVSQGTATSDTAGALDVEITSQRSFQICCGCG